MLHRAGETVDYVVTYLEMDARPAFPRPHLPGGQAAALIAAEAPPVWYFLGLYDAVGAAYGLTVRADAPAAAQAFAEALRQPTAQAVLRRMGFGAP